MLNKVICKTGLFGGTFDPPHWGHINLALELMEKRELNEVWFLPAHLNPHKADTRPASFAQRLEMVKLAIQDIPAFTVKAVEGERPPPSYTIDTIHACLALAAQDPVPRQFYWLMGADSMANFNRWYQYEEIVRLVPLLIGARWSHLPPEITEDHSLLRTALQDGFTQTRLLDIDSTEVRRRLIENLYCGHLVPSQVMAYIQQEGLYNAHYPKQ